MLSPAFRTVLVAVVLVVFGPACGQDAPTSRGPTALFDRSAASGPGAFFDFPYPSDLRRTADGAPDLRAFPNPGVPILDGLLAGAQQRRGFPTVPVGYFRFTKKPAPLDAKTVLPARGALMLVDVDPASPERGRTFPVVAHTPEPDAYVPENLVAVAARPGIVLAPDRTYAFVVTRDLPLVGGGTLAPAAAIAELARGATSDAALAQLYAPLFTTLDTLSVPRDSVVVATVFTTGDVVKETAALSDRVASSTQADLAGYALEPDESARHPGFCHVTASIELPQFQRGSPIFDTEGLFELDAQGAPIVQRTERVAVSLAVPRAAMPEGGFPLVLYLHGSGGVARELVDGASPPEPGIRWPAEVLADKGFAMAGQDLPISPGRVPGAEDFAYLNLNNPIAMRDTFRQGIIESRLLLSALERARIPASALTGCANLTLPTSEPSVRFALTRLSVQGQSMGAMYTNLLGAVEPRIEAAVPTGAGGYWMYFILETKIVPGAAGLLALLLRTAPDLTFMHPAMHVAETALEPVDPMVSAPRLGRRPLPGHPARAIYQPVGKDDSYFPASVLDAMALAYEHPRGVGDEVWASMAEAQRLVGIETLASYPVAQNLRSLDGRPYTGLVAQFDGQGRNGHGIYRYMPDVQHQFACFHASFRATGTATIPAPSSVGAACP